MREGDSGRRGSSREPAFNTGRSGRGPETESAPPVSQVGRYLLLKKLGEGGMGVVYSAYDPDLDRKVALKLLHADEQSDPEAARARLLREAQAMARVSHPNVIPIFDVGMWGDQVFLAMELVDGGTLSSWLKEAERPWREVLERFIAAGRGLQAAHEAGLVHRDFKPANVLVSRAGRVYVTDFGLARQVGDSPEAEPLPEEAQLLLPPERKMLEATITQKGLVMGTPNYMSPEQFQGGELDARSDQFSFCVSLYWGLFRARPFDASRMKAYSASRSHKAQKKEEDPNRTAPLEATVDQRKRPVVEKVPSAIIQEPPRDTKVPAWVRQAVMRGLGLEPGERYASMRELLEALSQERRLAARRRWVAAGATAGVALAVVGGAVYRQAHVCAGAGELMAEVWNPPARQKLEAAFTATKRPFAQETASRVAEVLEGYAAGWTRQRTEACEATRVHGTQPEELLSRRVVCLERRRKDLGALVGLLATADAPVVEKALDAAHALPSLEECADVESLASEQRLPSEPAKRQAIEALGGRLAEVKALVDAGRYPVALEKANALEKPVLDTGHLPLIAELRFHKGWMEAQLDQSPEGARELARAVYDAEAGRADRLKVSILNKLLFVEDGQRHFDQASDWGGLAEATLRRLGGDPLLEADVLVNRANLAASQEHLPEAKALLEQARALQDKALPPGHPKRARTTFLLGRMLLDLGERERAIAMLEEALKQTEASVGALHPDMARRHGLLAAALREQGKLPQALEHARATAHIRELTFGKASLPYAEAQDEVGQCLLGLHQFEESLRVFQEALATKQQVLPPEDPRLQPSYDGVGQALLNLDRPQESLEPLRKAVSFADMPPDMLADSGFALARALWVTGGKPEARSEAARARERFGSVGLQERVSEVDAWLESLPKEEAGRRAPPRPGRRTARK